MNSEENKTADKISEVEGRARVLVDWQLKLAACIAFLWSAFQMWYASPLPFLFKIGVFIDVPARGIHLCFALLLSFILFPLLKTRRLRPVHLTDFILALGGGYCALYLYLEYVALVDRNGVLLEIPFTSHSFNFSFPLELLLGAFGIFVLLRQHDGPSVYHS